MKVQLVIGNPMSYKCTKDSTNDHALTSGFTAKQWLSLPTKNNNGLLCTQTHETYKPTKLWRLGKKIEMVSLF